MPADSLFDMARKACGRYVSGLTDIGVVPYELIRPALIKINNPDQLYQIEQNCPQIIGEDGEIWLNMIRRDIPNWDTKPHQPSNPKNWYKVYRKLKEEAKVEMAQGEEKLRAALNSISANREQNTAQVITRNVVPAQAVNRRRQIAYNYQSGRTGSRGASKMTVLQKIRSQGRDASKKMSRPTHELGQRSSLVKRAPTAFVEDLKHKQQVRTSPVRTTAVRTTQMSNFRVPKPPLHKPAGDSPYNVMQDREARLQALKTGKQLGRTGSSKIDSGQATDNIKQGLTIDFLEDDENDDELFGASTKAKPAPKKVSGISSPQSTTLKRKAAPSMFTSGNAPKRRNPGMV